MDRPLSPIETAISRIGSQTELAAALTRLEGRVTPIHPSLISQWVTERKPIAAGHCWPIEQLTGVRCEQLRPDLVWTRNEAGQVTDYRVPVAVDRSH
jgi:DNA-binding transcriptional regulator YdaS (Cro superfamily)